MQLLDLYCCQGGAAAGYYEAGFTTIVGVDINPQPHYPYDFVQADALTYFEDNNEQFDAFHASPPCQAFVALSKLNAANPHKDFLTPTIERFSKIIRPYVIENVMSAPMNHNLMLCGSSFGLQVRRHRKFLSNVFIPQPLCDHRGQGTPIGVYGKFTRNKGYLYGRQAHNKEEASTAMGGLPWMTCKGIAEAIPPAYTAYIGRYLIEHLKNRR